MGTNQPQASDSIHDAPGAAGSPVQAVCALLADGDEADRCYAAHALGVFGRREAVPALLARLTDPDVDVCVDAATALGRIGDRAAIGPLLESLRKDPDGEVKTAVVEALVRLGGDEAVPALIEVARGRPAEMTFDDASEWDDWWDMQLAAVRGLGALGVTSASGLLEALLDDEDGQDIESEILAALARLGAPGHALLLRRLKAPEARTRRRAVRALGRTDTPETLEALGQALLDRAPEVRAAALEALAERGARRYLPPMLAFYRDHDAQVREAAVRATARLAECTGGAAPDQRALRPLLRDPDPRVRALALGSLDLDAGLDAELLATVRDALGEAHGQVAEAACAVLGRLGDGQVLEDLAALAADPAREDAVRRAALAALGELGAWTPAVAEAVSGALAEPGSGVRLAALHALRALHLAGAGSARPAGENASAPLELLLAALAGALHGDLDAEQTGDAEAGQEPDADPRPQAQAIPVELAPAGESVRPARSSLEAIAIDNAEVALALSGMGEEAYTATVELDDADREYLELTERNEAVARWLFARDTLESALDLRRLAARVLAALDDAPVVAALLDALSGADETLALEAAGSLAAIAERSPEPASHAGTLAGALDPLLARATSANRDLRIACIRALAFLARPQATAAIEAGLQDAVPAVRMQAAHALGVLARRGGAALAREVAGPLSACLADEDPGVRVAAASALADVLRDADDAARARGIGALVEAAYRGTGDQARDMGRALRTLAPARASAHLVALLARLGSSAERRFAIEMLEEIHGPDATEPRGGTQHSNTPAREANA